MNLRKLIAIISNEIGIDSEDLRKDTLLEELVHDEYEMQELMGLVAEEFGVEFDFEPGDDWSLEQLAEAIEELL